MKNEQLVVYITALTYAIENSNLPVEIIEALILLRASLEDQKKIHEEEARAQFAMVLLAMDGKSEIQFWQEWAEQYKKNINKIK